MKHTISVVRNRPGILAQVVEVFKKFDVNIKSVAVSETDLFETSRLTIVVDGSRQGREAGHCGHREAARRAGDRRSRRAATFSTANWP